MGIARNMFRFALLCFALLCFAFGMTASGKDFTSYAIWKGVLFGWQGIVSIGLEATSMATLFVMISEDCSERICICICICICIVLCCVVLCCVAFVHIEMDAACCCIAAGALVSRRGQEARYMKVCN